jgi:hypothetical protein
MSLRAEIRSLQTRLPTQPWLFARLADLMRREGRDGEALDLLREGVARAPDYPSGWQKLGEVQAVAGRHAEAARAWERCSEQVGGICAAWISRLDAASHDPSRHRELLQTVHELDRFSIARLREMRECGLIERADYEQSLRLTDSELRRREESYTRLLQRLGAGPALVAPPAAPAPQAAPSREPGATAAEAEEEAPAPQAAPSREPGATAAEAEEEAPAPQAAPSREPGATAAEAEEEAPAPQAAPSREPSATAAEAEEEAPAPQAAPSREPGATAAEAEEEAPAPQAAAAAPPADPARAARIAASAEHLQRLAEPLPRPAPVTAEAPPAATGAPASVMTRRLAEIYAAQGYWDLGIRVLEEVRRREPEARDLRDRLADLRRLKAEAAQAARPRGAGS